MPVTATYTVDEIVEEGLRLARVSADDLTPEPEQMARGRRAMDRMIKAWQTRGPLRFLYTSGTLTLSTDAKYTLTPVRPVRIINARLKHSGIEIPMQEMTRDEYDSLPVKTSVGLPTQYHYDRQREAAEFYVWPVLAAVNGETVEYTYEREMFDIVDGTEEVDLPAEWYEAVVYNLGLRITHLYPDTSPMAPDVILMAQQMLENVLGDDLEGSVYFAGYEDTYA